MARDYRLYDEFEYVWLGFHDAIRERNLHKARGLLDALRPQLEKQRSKYLELYKQAILEDNLEKAGQWNAILHSISAYLRLVSDIANYLLSAR